MGEVSLNEVRGVHATRGVRVDVLRILVDGVIEAFGRVWHVQWAFVATASCEFG
jgi:hypothetical protein